MANQDLYKQAIAEAKSIRETAVANAKQALEETLTPHIKSLLAARLQEMEEEDGEVVKEEEEVDEMQHAEGRYEEMDEAADDKEEDTDTEGDEEANDDSEESEDEAEVEDEEIEVKDMEVEDLKNLIRDIVAQEMGGMEGAEEDMDMNMGLDGGMDGEYQPNDMVGADDEEIDLNELLAELDELSSDRPVTEARKGKKDHKKKVEDDKKKKAEHEKEKKTKKDLDEALYTISVLRSELSEVNLLNAKLLYVNKIFKSNNLTETQKASTISAFDKAASPKEVKLVYETLKEGLATKKPATITLKEHRGFASKSAGVAPKKEIISEVSEQIRRMQKLAGII